MRLVKRNAAIMTKRRRSSIDLGDVKDLERLLSLSEKDGRSPSPHSDRTRRTSIGKRRTSLMEDLGGGDFPPRGGSPPPPRMLSHREKLEQEYDPRLASRSSSITTLPALPMSPSPIPVMSGPPAPKTLSVNAAPKSAFKMAGPPRMSMKTGKSKTAKIYAVEDKGGAYSPKQSPEDVHNGDIGAVSPTSTPIGRHRQSKPPIQYSPVGTISSKANMTADEIEKYNQEVRKRFRWCCNLFCFLRVTTFCSPAV